MQNFTRILFATTFLWSTAIHICFAQVGFNVPDGCKTIASLPLSNNTTVTIAATRVGVYVNGDRILSTISSSGLTYTDIVSIHGKLFTNDLLVMCKNGTGYQLTYLPATDSWVIKDFDKVPDDNVKKMVGDDLYAMSFDAVFVSDSGFNWIIDTAGLDGTYLRDIAIDTTQKVWLATQNGLFTQLLNEMSWVKNTAHGTSNVDLVHVDRKQNVWTSNYNVLRVTVDGGLSFQNSPAGLPNGYIRKITDDAFGNIYVMYDSTLYYSQGGTQPFIKISRGLMEDFTLMGQYLFNNVSADTLIYLATEAGLYTSANQGNTWTYVANAVSAEHINSLTVTADDRLLMTSNLGAYRFESNQTWSIRYPQNGFLPDTKIFTATNGDIYLVAENKGVNSGNNYRRMVYKSTDNGNTFSPDTAGLAISDAAMSDFFVDESGVQHASGSVYVLGGPSQLRVWKKMPSQPWELDIVGLPSLGSNHSLQCFGTAYNGKVYAAIMNSGTTTIYSRPLSGGNWTSETTVFGGVIDIKGRNGKITAGTSGGLVYNAGSGWKTAPPPSTITQPVTWSISEVDYDGVVWAYFETVNNKGSIGEGIYYTSNFVNWIEPEGNEDTLLFSELVAVGDSVFALGAGNNGIYVFDTLQSVQLSVNKILKADKIRIIPNPFHNNTTLQFDLNAEGQVAFSIYNLLGDMVFSIPARQANKGIQQLEINLPQVARGILIYELNVNGTVTRGKLLVQQ